MKYLLLMPIVFVFTSCSSIMPKNEINGTIIEYGIFERSKQEKNISSPASDAGTKFVTTSWGKQIERTTKVQAKLGSNTLFGYIFKIEGFDQDGEINLRKTVIHPEIIKPDGTKSEGFSYIDPFMVENGKIESYSGWSFDHPYELVDGEWIIKFEYRGKVILEKAFTIYK